MGKFNVGDKVRIVSKRGACWNFKGEMDHWCNKVMTIRETISGGNLYLMEEDKHENGGNGWCWGNQDIVGIVNPEKIVITHDGKTTTATLYKADGSKEKATARCAPEDTFDFNFGANLAMERLIGKVNPPEEGTNIKFNTGDYAKIIANKHGHRFKIGTIVRLEKGAIDYTAYAKDDFWYVQDDELEAYTPPKYYNGKVVCVENTHGNTYLYTVGKIYEFVDGSFVADDGSKVRDWYTNVESFDQWCRYSSSKWIEVVD